MFLDVIAVRLFLTCAQRNLESVTIFNENRPVRQLVLETIKSKKNPWNSQHSSNFRKHYNRNETEDNSIWLTLSTTQNILRSNIFGANCWTFAQANPRYSLPAVAVQGSVHAVSQEHKTRMQTNLRPSRNHPHHSCKIITNRFYGRLSYCSAFDQLCFFNRQFLSKRSYDIWRIKQNSVETEAVIETYLWDYELR